MSTDDTGPFGRIEDEGPEGPEGSGQNREPVWQEPVRQYGQPRPARNNVFAPDPEHSPEQGDYAMRNTRYPQHNGDDDNRSHWLRTLLAIIAGLLTLALLAIAFVLGTQHNHTTNTVVKQGTNTNTVINQPTPPAPPAKVIVQSGLVTTTVLGSIAHPAPGVQVPSTIPTNAVIIVWGDLKNNGLTEFTVYKPGMAFTTVGYNGDVQMIMISWATNAQGQEAGQAAVNAWRQIHYLLGYIDPPPPSS